MAAARGLSVPAPVRSSRERRCNENSWALKPRSCRQSLAQGLVADRFAQRAAECGHIAGATSKPHFPSTTISFKPPTAEAITGTPQARASKATRPNGSINDGTTQISTEFQNCGILECGMIPREWTRPLALHFLNERG